MAARYRPPPVGEPSGPNGRPVSVMGFTVADGKIVAIDAIGDPERLAHLDLSALDD